MDLTAACFKGWSGWALICGELEMSACWMHAGGRQGGFHGRLLQGQVGLRWVV